MKKNRIAILLPFKDHFTHSKAGSASIWVKDFNKRSIYKKQIVVFGNTNNLNDLIDKKSYKNLTLNTSGYGSKNISYVNEFIKCIFIYKYYYLFIFCKNLYVYGNIK